MKETGILFKTDMVKAILDGTKTQTRRVIKFPYENKLGVWEPTHVTPEGLKDKYGEPAVFKPYWGMWHTRTGKMITCPYGQVGDLMWVRETLEKRNDGYAIYAADKEQVLIGGRGINEGVSWEWKKDTLNGMYMPRWASRITLEITEVRVERLRIISPVDAMAGGGYTVEEFIKLYLKINHLPDDADPWNFVLNYKLI